MVLLSHTSAPLSQKKVNAELNRQSQHYKVDKEINDHYVIYLSSFLLLSALLVARIYLSLEW